MSGGLGISPTPRAGFVSFSARRASFPRTSHADAGRPVIHFESVVHVDDAQASDDRWCGARSAAHVDEDEESGLGRIVAAPGDADTEDGWIGHDGRGALCRN